MRFIPKLLSTTCLTAVLLCVVPDVCANPVGGSVTSGQAAITSSGSQLNVTQQTDRAIIDWRTFNIAPGETTQFIQPGSGSVTLNRVNTGGASQINGNLIANGNLVIINQNGIVFGQGARVDVNGLIATTADIDNNSFMAGGTMNFNKPGNPNASIINNGQITAKEAGLVGFVAPNVINSGVISAKLGTVHLASGDTATIDMYGDDLMEVAVSDSVKSQLVSNTGTIKANGGTIALTAAAGSQIVNSLINVQGTLQAQSIHNKNGQIIIAAAGSNAVAGNVASQKGLKQGSSTVVVQGTLDASGKKHGQTGGAITVTGDNVSILNGSVLDVSGDIGGGVIQIGGNFHGQGTTPTALNTFVDTNTSILANAISSGNGGDVTVWADGITSFAGSIEAMGGANGGNGGYVETSGKQSLFVSGNVNARAPYGSAGTWLLDPNNAIISSNSTSNPGYSARWSAGAGGGNISTSDILSSLDNGTSVTVNASGTITVSSEIDERNYSGTVGLSLDAGSDIILNSSINTFNSANLNLSFNSGGTIYANGVNLSTNGGTLAFNAPVMLSGSNNFNAGDSGTMSFGSTMNGAGSLNMYAGTFSMNGTFGGSTALGALSISAPDSITLANAITAASLSVDTTHNGGEGNADITLGGTVTSTAGDINITSGLDFNAQNVISSGNVSINAVRNLTVGNVTDGSTGSLTLEAANQYANGNGLLTLNGNFTLGTGSLTLLSGEGNSGSRNNLNFGVTQEGATIGQINIQGEQNLDIENNITTSTNFNLSNMQDFTSQDITADGTIFIYANRNITLGNLTTDNTDGIFLASAGQNINNQGIITLNGNLNSGTGDISLYSGVDSSGNRATDSFAINALNGGVGNVQIDGFQQVTLTSNLVSNNGITIQNDIGLTAQNITGAGGVYAYINGNLTVGNVTSGAGNGISLYAAGDSPNSQGILTINGNLSNGTGDINLVSGHDGSGNRPNANFSLTQQGSTVGSVQMLGFNNLTVTGNINSSGSINIQNINNLSTQNLSAANGIYAYINGNVSVGNLSAANGNGIFVAAASENGNAVGQLTVGSNITGSGDMSFYSGVDGSGNRSSFDSGITSPTGSIGRLTLNGFEDITLTSNVTSNTNISLTPSRDVTTQDLTANGGIYIYTGRNITTGNLTTDATDGITLDAGTGGGVGVLNLNGNITSGSGNITLSSGVDGSGNGSNLDIGVTALNSSGVGIFQAYGFNNITLNTNLVSTGNVYLSGNTLSTQDITATNGIYSYVNGNITVGNVTVGPTAGIDLEAGNVNGHIGTLTINGNLTNGTGNLKLYSNVNTSGNYVNASFAVNDSGSSLGAVTINGFQNLTLLSNLNASGDIDLSEGGVLSVESLSGNNINLNASSIALNGTAGTTRTFTASSGYINMYAPLNAGNLNLSLVADYLSGSHINTLTSASSGAGRILTLSPYSTGNSLGVADNATCGGSCGLTFGNSVLNNITSNWSSLVIGNAAETGVVDVRPYNFTTPVTFLSGTGGITTPGAITLTGNTTFTSNGGTVAFGGAIDGDYNLTVSGNSLSFASALGSSTALNAVSLTSVGSLSLPSIDATSILAQTTGTNSNITIPSGDILTASGTGVALTLASSHNFFNDEGADALSASAGRWMVYSANPTGDTLGNLAPNFIQYNATYGTTALAQNTGDGFLYTLAPTITVGLTGTVDKTYDQTTAATLASGNYNLTGVVNNDTVVISEPTSGAYDNANAGTGKTVSSTVSLTSASNGSATVYGYQLASSTASGAVGEIDAKQVTASLTGTVDKTYDQTTAATLASGNYNLTGVLTGDTVNLSDPTSGLYNNANAGTGKTVSVSGLTLSGAGAGNYVLASTSINAAVGEIDPKQITATLTGTVDKTYDQTTAATLAAGNYSLTGVFSGDTVNLNDPTSGLYNNANAGTGKTVSVSGLTLAGASAGNYVLASTSINGTVGIIDPKLLTVTLTGTVDKTYDQTTTATLAAGNYNITGILTGDTIHLNDPTSGLYDNANAGTGKTVSVNGLVISGSSIGNYQLAAASISGAVGEIDPKQVTASLTGTVQKAYDGSTTATLGVSNYNLTGVLSGDTVNLNDPALGAFADASAGTGKLITVTGLNLLGANASNYRLTSYTTYGSIGTITAPPVVAAAVAVVPTTVQLVSQAPTIPLPVYAFNNTTYTPAITYSVSVQPAEPTIAPSPVLGQPIPPIDPNSNDIPRALPVNTVGNSKPRKFSHGMLEIDPMLAKELNL